MALGGTTNSFFFNVSHYWTMNNKHDSANCNEVKSFLLLLVLHSHFNTHKTIKFPFMNTMNFLKLVFPTGGVF